MYTTIIHPIRNALCLSLNEYCILDSVYRLSQNIKYGGWCVQSKNALGEDLSLSERTVFKILKTLEEKDLIVKNDRGSIKTADTFNEMMANKKDWLIGFDGKESKFISGKVKDPAEFAGGMQKLHSNYAESAGRGMKKVHGNYAESSYNNKKTIRTNNNNNKTGVEKKLIKWFSEMDDVASPSGLSRILVEKYGHAALDKALKSSSCTSRAQLTKLAEHYAKKLVEDKQNVMF